MKKLEIEQAENGFIVEWAEETRNTYKYHKKIFNSCKELIMFIGMHFNSKSYIDPEWGHAKNAQEVRITIPAKPSNISIVEGINAALHEYLKDNSDQQQKDCIHNG